MASRLAVPALAREPSQAALINPCSALLQAPPITVCHHKSPGLIQHTCLISCERRHLLLTLTAFHVVLPVSLRHLEVLPDLSVGGRHHTWKFSRGAGVTRGTEVGTAGKGPTSLTVPTWKSHYPLAGGLESPPLECALQASGSSRLRQLCYEGNAPHSPAPPTSSCSHRPRQLSQYLSSRPGLSHSTITTPRLLFTLGKKTTRSV